MSYREPDPIAKLRERVTELEGEAAALHAVVDSQRRQLDARPGPLARAWRALGGWLFVALPVIIPLAVFSIAWWVISASDAANDEKARALCERVCGESLVDVRRVAYDDVTCLCDDEDGLRAIEPWSVDE